mmetsp:Transcript_112611/g.223901  ORF Transcript_112611/g.223901 Transcript_112611/m.223901 type:complete len:511 (+) Transcript_112611:69-1601(+)
MTTSTGLPPELLLPGAAAANLPTSLWQALCDKKLADIQQCQNLNEEELEKQLNHCELRIPGPTDRRLRVVQDPKGGFGASTGAVVWPAAVTLLEMLDSEFETSNRSVIELGAGLGAVGQFLAKYKGCQVVLSEVAEALPLLAMNVMENFDEGDQQRPRVAQLNWADSVQRDVLGTFDLVLGSDITYRDNSLPELLETIGELLRPDGRAFLTLQDRPNEGRCLEEALTANARDRSRGRLRTQQRKEIRQNMNGLLDGCAHQDEDVLVLVYELRKEKEVQRPNDWCPSTPAEVEDEFARITGIRPDPLFPESNGKWPRTQASEATAAPCPKPTLRERIEKDLRERGLEEYLDGSMGNRQKDLAMRQAVMKAQEAAESDEALWDKTWETRCAAEMAQPETQSQLQEKATAEVCFQGLDWSVDTTETHVQAVVSFNESLWQTLQGSSDACVSGRSSAAFRKAVNFELAEKELRVLHADTVVLQLQLQHTINPDGGSAKVSGTNRRVTVSAPLCS